MFTRQFGKYSVLQWVLIEFRTDNLTIQTIIISKIVSFVI